MMSTRATVRLPSQQLDEVDKLVDQGVYPNRSEAIRAAIRNFLDDHDDRQHHRSPRLRSDGGSSPHEEPLGINEGDGLCLPESYVGYEGGLVVRMPNGGTIDFKPRPWTYHVGNVVPRHFGEDGEEPNGHLGPDEVSLKKYGEPAEVFRVDVDGGRSE